MPSNSDDVDVDADSDSDDQEPGDPQKDIFPRRRQWTRRASPPLEVTVCISNSRSIQRKIGAPRLLQGAG